MMVHKSFNFGVNTKDKVFKSITIKYVNEKAI